MFDDAPRDPPPTEALHRSMDRFLARWAWVRAANMEAFGAQAAAWFRMPPPPRRATDLLPPLGIRIRRETLPPGVAAVWVVEEGAYLIRLSPFQTAPRANFTLWHEFFEIMAARPCFPSPLAGRAAERRADAFAAALTMPRADLYEAARSLAGAGDKTAVLADRFGVSAAAMRHRLRTLRPAPFGASGPRVPRII